MHGMYNEANLIYTNFCYKLRAGFKLELIIFWVSREVQYALLCVGLLYMYNVVVDELYMLQESRKSLTLNLLSLASLWSSVSVTNDLLCNVLNSASFSSLASSSLPGS